MDDEFVGISLEGDTKTYKISKAILRNVSDYFKTALEGHFSESNTRVLKLPDCTSNTLQLFLYYLGSSKRSTDPMFLQLEHIIEQPELARLWVFGQQYLIPNLQNEAIKALDELLQEQKVELEALRVAFTQTSERSKLRDRMIEEMYRENGQLWEEAGTSKEQLMGELAVMPGYLMALSEEMLRVHGERINGDIGIQIDRRDLQLFLVPET